MKTKPRVLLLSATSGAGHVRAAQALEKAFLARGDCAVEHVDALQHVSKLFQRVYDKAYISMVRRRPGIEGRPLRPHGPAVAARAAAPCAGSAEHWTDDPSVKTHPAGPLCGNAFFAGGDHRVPDRPAQAARAPRHRCDPLRRSCDVALSYRGPLR